MSILLCFYFLVIINMPMHRQNNYLPPSSLCRYELTYVVYISTFMHKYFEVREGKIPGYNTNILILKTPVREFLGSTFIAAAALGEAGG